MIEALTVILALYALAFLFIIGALGLARRADLRAEHEMQRKVARAGEGLEGVHTHFDTQNGKRNHD